MDENFVCGRFVVSPNGFCVARCCSTLS